MLELHRNWNLSCHVRLETELTHPADDLQEALRQLVGLLLQQRNVRIHSKQPQLPVFLHAVKAWRISEEPALPISRWIAASYYRAETSHTARQEMDRPDISPSESSFRKLFGRSACIMSPPRENTVFMVSMNHSLSGAYVWSLIGKSNSRKRPTDRTNSPVFFCVIAQAKSGELEQVYDKKKNQMLNNWNNWWWNT